MPAIVAKVDTLDRDIDVLLEDMTPQGAKKAFVAIARQERDRAVAQNTRALGRKPTYTTSVNGHIGAHEDRVTLPGTIIYEFDIATQMVAEIVGLLKKHSPVFKGRYRESFAVFVDGTEVADPMLATADYQEVVILSTVAYARKIERGLSKQTPNGVFQVVAAMASRKYSAIASIKFSYGSPLSPSSTHLEAWARKTGQTRERFARGGNKAEFDRGEWNRRQPAIQIRLK